MKGFIEVDGMDIKIDSIICLDPTVNQSTCKTSILTCSGDSFCVTASKEEIKRLMCGGN